MTILATSNIKTLYMNHMVQTGKLGTTGVAITLYGGAKPTAANYIANFNPTYNSGSADFLWHGSGATQWIQSNGTVFLGVPPTASVPLHDGVATWAVIWCAQIAVGSMTAGFPTSGSSGFILCDVSTVDDGTGIVQLQSTTLSTGSVAITINTAGFIIT